MSDKDVAVYAGAVGVGYVIKFEPATFKKFAEQTAASIIVACKGYPRDGSSPKEDPIGSVLTKRMSWADHGYTNALISQVEFLYALVVCMTETGRKPFATDIETAKLIADALDEFQKWKTDVCNAEQLIHGKNWATATGFFKTNWADKNKKFLSLWKSLEKDKEK